MKFAEYLTTPNFCCPKAPVHKVNAASAVIIIRFILKVFSVKIIILVTFVSCSNTKNNMSKRVLVSGGAGFIGSHVTVELIQSGYEVVVADDMSNCDMTCFEGVKKITGREDIPFIKMNFCDLDAVNKLFSEFQIDAVIHFAAFKAVGESVSEPVKYYSNNLSSFLNVIEAAKTHGGCNVLFSSSATVYGEPESSL